MTDLVQKLVGALEEAEEWVQEYVTQMRLYVISDSAAKSLANIRAALSEAKAGGWVAVPVEPTQAMLDAADKVQDGCNFGLDDIYKAMLAARPLPAPPAQRGEV